MKQPPIKRIVMATDFSGCAEQALGYAAFLGKACPARSDLEPIGPRTDSRGRFLAVKTQDLLDPATVAIGTRITLVGEVSGSTTLPVDEIEYVYPDLDIKALTIWPPKLPAGWFRPSPYVGAYWGPYWGPYLGPARGPWGWY